MNVWRGCMIGLGVLLRPAPDVWPGAGQSAATQSRRRPSRRRRHRPASPRSAAPRASPPAQPGAPHTLAEALAATYATHPALLAERAQAARDR